MQVSCCVQGTQENGQAINEPKLFVTEFNARENWIRPTTRVGDKLGNQSLPRNFMRYFKFSKKCYVDLCLM